jgi:hypothetical protein
VCSQAALAEKAATEAQEKIDAQALPIRTYLDQTVVPILLQGLSDLVKQRCECICEHDLFRHRLSLVLPALMGNLGRGLVRDMSDGHGCPCRPEDPVEHLAAYLMKHNPKNKK